MMRFLTAIPVYNEERHLDEVLTATRPWSPELLVVDDGSTDQTPALLARHAGVHVLRHASNEGYGAALRDAFRFSRHRETLKRFVRLSTRRHASDYLRCGG